MTRESEIICAPTWRLSGRVDETGPIRHVSIDSSPFRVGRRNDLSFCLPTRTVSGVHAEFTIEGEQLWVRDLQSTNGTYVNGHAIADPTKVFGGDLVQFAEVAFRIDRVDGAIEEKTITGDSCDDALSLIQFDKLLSERAVVPFFQPIVAMTDRRTIGFEVLGRSRLFGLTQPNAMFMAAAKLNLEAELSRLFRSEAIQVCTSLPGPNALFLNTHPIELNDLRALQVSLRELRESSPVQNITLEIHEAAITDAKRMLELRSVLNDLDMRLAYDDFGAGQARLLELVEVPSDYLKFDMALVRNLHQASVAKQRIVEALVKTVRELGITPIAEGIETQADCAACTDIGFELGQGYFFGKPAAVEIYGSP